MVASAVLAHSGNWGFSVLHGGQRSDPKYSMQRLPPPPLGVGVGVGVGLGDGLGDGGVGLGEGGEGPPPEPPPSGH